MPVFHADDDFEPLTLVRGVPVYVTTALVALHVGAFFAGWAVVVAGRGEWLMALVFRSGAGWSGLAGWLGYALVEPLRSPLFFAVEMVLLYLFGREVERYIGRRHYLLLYLVLALVPPVLLAALGLWLPASLAGARAIHLAIFVAFAALYPGVMFFFSIQARWMAAALVGIAVFFDLSGGNWPGACATGVDAGVALLFIAWIRGRVWLPSFPMRLRPQTRKSGREVAPVRKERRERRDPVEAIDPLLDKIAREGMESLSAGERDALEKARRELLARKPRS